MDLLTNFEFVTCGLERERLNTCMSARINIFMLYELSCCKIVCGKLLYNAMRSNGWFTQNYVPAYTRWCEKPVWQLLRCGTRMMKKKSGIFLPD